MICPCLTHAVRSVHHAVASKGAVRLKACPPGLGACQWRGSKVSSIHQGGAVQGSLLYKHRIAGFDDPMVEVLEANGALIIGKSNTPEFGAGGNTFNECGPPPCCHDWGWHPVK
jgi:hypothetical protein